MDFDKKLTGKILDPIHGIIRLSDLEIKFIDHPLFQRLRNIKQNTFLYKVFPSAMHSRFEHSLGVMHLSYETIKNLKLNSYRYKNKYKDKDSFHIFNDIEKLSLANIQELRLAALLHDIGHGPMSHQFDSFMCKKEELNKHIGNNFSDVFDMIPDKSHIEHEHISIIFVKIIYDSLDKKYQNLIDIDNVIKIIERKYKDQKIEISIEGCKLDVLPLFTSIISSCPIDADRMDYLLRDSYFSGVKCGLYDYNRLFMSIVPIISDHKIFLAYKESGIDSVAEFINARSSLFGQVYYHKTNRSFSAMLDKVCQIITEKNTKNKLSAFEFYEENGSNNKNKIDLLKDFYISNSDDYFLNKQLSDFLRNNTQSNEGKNIISDLINRTPWSKIYETKIHHTEAKITDKVNRDFIEKLKDRISNLLKKHFHENFFSVDIVTDNAFKDIEKTKIKLLTKNLLGSYDIKDFNESGSKLDKYQLISYFVRVFILESNRQNVPKDLIDEIEEIKNELDTEFFHK